MRVLFRVDASASIGGGHAIRCLALAETLAASGAHVTFASAEMLPSLDCELAARGIAVLEPEEASRHDFAWIVVDHYALDAAWERPLRAHGSRILVIDDICNRQHDCDILVDPTFGRAATEYSSFVPQNCRVLTGPKYAFLRPRFAELRSKALERRRIPRPAERLLISLGLTDVGGLTLPVLGAALDCAGTLEVDVAIGSVGPSLPALRELARSRPGLHIHVDTDRMAEIMAEADIAIGASGSSSWERCCLGLPSIIFVLAENQRRIGEELARAGACTLVNPDDPCSFEEALRRLLDDPVMRSQMAMASAAISDGLGAGRVADWLLR